MATNLTLSRAVKIALITTAAYGTAAVAQDTEIEQIVVTGSRIATPNLEAISPVASISAADIKATGQNRIEDILNNLPQVFAEQGSTVSNGSDGTATVNLRGLGSQRTLVLVNGRRMSPGNPQGGSAADLNQIPGALVERVEILTGGASSVYGADAVAGVVNFIMKNNFEGFRLDTNLSTYWHNNHNNEIQDVIDAYPSIKKPTGEFTAGDSADITAILGINTPDGKGNATAYFGYRSVDAVLQDKYDYSGCSLTSTKHLPNSHTGKRFGCGGSYTSYPGYFEIPGEPGYTIGDGQTLVPFDPNTDLYNYGPLNYYQRPDTRYTAGLFAHYEYNEHADVYSEFQYMKDRTVAQIAPSGLFFSPVITMGCSSPLLSASMVQTWCTDRGLTSADSFDLYIGRRNVEGGGRQNDLTHTSYRGVLGVKGDINDAWKYDVYALQAETSVSNVYLNDFYKARVAQALDVVQNPDGSLACADPTGGCVPWNIFNPGHIDPAALKFLQVPAIAVGNARTRVASANFTGDLGKYGVMFPTAKDGIAVNVGAEWRSEETLFQPDYIYQTGALTGQGGSTDPVSGGFAVKELFMEARLPFVQDHTFAKSLSADLGYRYSDYDLGFNTSSWKAGLEWAPVEDIRFRGGFNRAVRSPNVSELFSPQSVSLDGNSDPCAGTLAELAANPLATPENCARAGVLPGQYGNITPNAASQYNGLQGGNPNLKPETADTVTFGIVFQPTFVRGLYVTLDYFDIKVKDVINGIGADLILNQCLSANQFCDLIHRNANGSLWRDGGWVVDTLQNLGELQTSGIDIDARYTFETDAWGTFTTSLIGTKLQKLETQPLPNGNKYDCAGLYGTVCGTPNPEWRHTLREAWTTPWSGLSLSLAWRYYDSVKLDATNSNSAFAGAPNYESDRKLDSRSYLDIGGSYAFAEKYNVNFGINNVLDQDPPVTGGKNCPAGICNGNTYAQVYDTLGRYLFLGFTANF